MSVPNEGFVASLTSMDSALRVRWGGCVGKWVIDRKAFTPIHELEWLRKRRAREAKRVVAGKSTTDLNGIKEEILSLETGYRVIIFTNVLNDEVYRNLCLTDITAYGGYSRYADEVEREVRERESRDDLTYAALCESIAKDAFGTGNGGLSPYDFLMSKKRRGVLREFQRGEKTLKQALGLRPEQSILSSESRIEPKRTKVLVDEHGRAFNA